MKTMEARRQLNDLGFVLLPNVMDAGMQSRLRERVEELFASEGEAAGREFKTEPGARRLANLVNKGTTSLQSRTWCAAVFSGRQTPA